MTLDFRAGLWVGAAIALLLSFLDPRWQIVIHVLGGM